MDDQPYRASYPFAPEPAMDRFDRQAITDHHESPDITLATDKKDPMERTDPADPTPPMENTEPIEHTDNTELREPMERTEFRDQSDHREPLPRSFMEPFLTLVIVRPNWPERREGDHLRNWS
jgi:hypothetical protein